MTKKLISISKTKMGYVSETTGSIYISTTDWNTTFEKVQCFYEIFLMSLYTIRLCKLDTCSCKKAAWTSAKTLGKDCSCESGSLHGVYRQKDNHIYTDCKLVKSHFLKMRTKLSIAMCCHISLTCLWVSAYIIFIIGEPGFIIQYDIMQAPCNTLVQ